MIIREYVRPASIDEAYEILKQKKSNRILGGCTFLNQQNCRINTAIDLQDCGLDYIEAKDDYVAIGAYTSFREIEISELLKEKFGGVFKDVLEHLVGVQLRSAITIGAHVASRFGFSDMIPLLMSLNAEVQFYDAGMMKLTDYMKLDRKLSRDILVEVRIPLEGRKTKTQMVRREYSDYAIFNLSVSRAVGQAPGDAQTTDQWIVAAGIRPGKAQLAGEVMQRMNSEPVGKKDAAELAEQIADSFVFGTNFRGSAEYRRELCRVFARRAIEELADDN